MHNDVPMMSRFSSLSFLFRMAWRDSRSSRRRLLLFSISISLGVAALIAIGLFRASLAQAIEDQARSLLGADLVVESSRPFTTEQEQMLRSLGETQAREVRLRTMAFFPKSGGTRLVYVRALGGNFPFYGKMETAPSAAAHDFRKGGKAVPEESLLLQFHAQAGDPIRIGEATFTIAGALMKMPGEASPAASFAPRVYIPLQNLAQTNLLKPGSLARYLNFVKFAPNVEVAAEVQKLAPRIEQAGLEYDTVAKRKKDLGESLDNLYRFLNLVGFISLLLGAVGVASAIQTHLQQKTRTAAVLRCLGAAGRTTVGVYFVQAMAMGIIGALIGAAIGLTMHQLLPGLLQNYIPFAFSRTIAWPPVWGGMAIGFGVCLLFALPPLLRFRRVSPLLTLRASVEENAAPVRRDFVNWIIYAVIAASLTAFAVSQAEAWTIVHRRRSGGGDRSADRDGEAAHFSRAQTPPTALELCPAARAGQPLPAKQSYPPPHPFVRLGHFSASHHLSDARRPPDPVPFNRRAQSAQHFPFRHSAGAEEAGRRSR